MFIAAFPPLARDKEFTEDNVEEWLLRSRKVMGRFAEEVEKNTVTNIMAQNRNVHGAGGWW
jgi:hypothetical protein